MKKLIKHYPMTDRLIVRGGYSIFIFIFFSDAPSPPVAKKCISIIKKSFINTHTRSKNTSCKVNNSFMFKFVLLKPSLGQKKIYVCLLSHVKKI